MSVTTIPTAGIADNAVTAAKASGFGRIGQVIYTRYTTQTRTTSDSYVDSGFSASITPSLSSSKILVHFELHFETFGNDADTEYGGNFKIVRTLSGSDTDVFIEPNDMPRIKNAYTGSSFARLNFSLSELDEPSTTSACTYKIFMKTRDNGATTNNRLSISEDSSISTVTLMEVLA